MKRIVALVLALLLCTCFMACSTAEAAEFTVKARDVSLNKYTNTIAVRLEDQNYYRIIDADGNVLMDESREYTYMSATSSYGFFKVEVKSADGIHDEGLVDGRGNVLVPPEYADVNIISDRWQAGVKLTPCAADDKDYTYSNWSSGEKSFFRVDTADIFFDGQKVGTLNRSDYGGGYCTAHNAYLCVTTLAKEKVFYNSQMERSPYQATTSSEFDTAYKKGVTTYIHQGSGQKAFDPACTLDPAELENPYVYEKGAVLDLQGNILFKTAQAYDTVRAFKNGYALVRIFSLNGLIDLEGREVIPAEYEELGDYGSSLVPFGYISAVKDGKFGFLDAKANVTCPFVYAKEVVNDRGCFATVKNLDGTIIVLSAAVGELPEHFADVSFPNYNGSMAFVGENAQKDYCVVDLYGNTLLPYSDTYRSIDLSVDGTVGVVSYGNREYGIFQFEIGAPAASEAPAAPAADDGSWTCDNGHSGNTGKFCSECGQAKPAQEAAVAKCPTCGYEFGDQTPKFCPECGTKIEK